VKRCGTVAHGLAGKLVFATARDEAVGDEITAGRLCSCTFEEAVVVGKEQAGRGDEAGEQPPC
jgi:hypothetical protein